MVAHPLRMRWRETVLAGVSMGYEALPVIVSTTFLIGISFAVATLEPLRQFGAEIYITNTVALGLVRGVGPVLTGIILAGRTGASITAELGIMKVNQEIDVLRTMGVSPVRALVLPRVVAAMVATPMLAVVAMLSGFVGAGLVVLSIDYPLATFVGRSVEALRLGDFYGSLFKALVFGFVYAVVSSYCGLTTGRGPADVGVSVRSAVVQGMIWVILFDSALVTAYHRLGI
jgi:phospholipid/cholesterol/gamma-HCH transport system permease protein